MSIGVGVITGLLISFKKLFEPVPDDQLFDDEIFWNIADDDNAGYADMGAKSSKTPTRRRSRARSITQSDNSAEIAAIAKMVHSPNETHLHPASAAYLS